jgi:MFS family permease
MTSEWTIVMQIGTFLGYISFGFVADMWNRKHAYIAYLVAAAALVPVFAFVSNSRALLVIGSLVGFFGTGYFSGFVVIAGELFPTALRATAMGFVYNIGRLASAVAPWAIGRISERAGLGAALCLTSAGFLLAAIIATALRPANLVEIAVEG